MLYRLTAYNNSDVEQTRPMHNIVFHLVPYMVLRPQNHHRPRSTHITAAVYHRPRTTTARIRPVGKEFTKYVLIGRSIAVRRVRGTGYTSLASSHGSQVLLSKCDQAASLVTFMITRSLYERSTSNECLGNL